MFVSVCAWMLYVVYAGARELPRVERGMCQHVCETRGVFRFLWNVLRVYVGGYLWLKLD